ncbi:MAG: efflux RND transporter periplasmic adaptor subunit [Spirochaetia bacterium]|nr:efflux RND transporter periplasmic adaptor subunit [Spirochaetia bacterium]
MDIEKVKKARPFIAGAVILTILGFWLVPKMIPDRGGITASGTIEVREVDVASRISSRVASISAREGDAVKKGQVMAVLDDSIVAAQRDAAAAVFKNAQDIYNRSSNLFKDSAISQQQYDAAKANYISSMSQLKQAEVMYDESLVKSPWDGIILKRHVEEGELVSPSAPLFTVGDLSEARVTIYMPLKEMTVIKHGQAAQVSVDAFEGKVFEGKVTYISGEAEFTPKNIQTKDERVKQVFKVEVTVKNSEGYLKPGIPADVVITK